MTSGWPVDLLLLALCVAVTAVLIRAGEAAQKRVAEWMDGLPEGPPDPEQVAWLLAERRAGR